MSLSKRVYWAVGLVGILALAGAALTLTAQLTSAGSSTPTADACAQDTGDESVDVQCQGANDAADGQTADDGVAIEDGTNDGETADDGVAVEDGTKDGETADDSAGAGQLDDGKDLLPKAGITIDAAIAAAQGAATGNLGEIDLEDYNGTLVFNVDVGGNDVKVDAGTGAVLAANASD
jgi:uncharacterized membrane protein YkoI